MSHTITDRILASLRDQGPCTGAELVLRLQLPAGSGNSVLSLLEFFGRVRQSAGRYELTELGKKLAPPAKLARFPASDHPGRRRSPPARGAEGPKTNLTSLSRHRRQT
jgi:hypothetical protein